MIERNGEDLQYGAPDGAHNDTISTALYGIRSQERDLGIVYTDLAQLDIALLRLKETLCL